MKRVAIAIVSIVVLMIIAYSCTSHQKCDAYSSKNRDKVETVRY